MVLTWFMHDGSYGTLDGPRMVLVIIVGPHMVPDGPGMVPDGPYVVLDGPNMAPDSS